MRSCVLSQVKRSGGQSVGGWRERERGSDRGKGREREERAEETVVITFCVLMRYNKLGIRPSKSA